MKKKSSTTNIIFVVFLMFLFSCSTKKNVVSDDAILPDTNLIPTNKMNGGASGMTQLSPHSFLGVYDIKTYAEGPRVAHILSVPDNPIDVKPIVISDWNDPEGKASDLESICRIGNSGNEFLMAESGNWQGNYGRIFHLKVDTLMGKGQILGTVKLPFIATNDFDLVGDQYEGMACFRLNEEEVVLILAERGGSEAFPAGTLRWGMLNLKEYTLEFSDTGMKGVTVDAPGNWSYPSKKRDITALHIDKNNEIWASGSQDISDSGPFYSVIYKLGKLSHDKINPVEVYNDLEIWREISGYKIEALSGPSIAVPNSKISFATEDENFGGNWRAIE